MSKQVAHLEAWYQRDNILFGNVYGHPRFTEGYPIHTSRIISLDVDAGACETLNTKYTLGKPYAVPVLPPFPPSPEVENYDLVRYGIKWNGPTTPLPTVMPDGYWTPWHIAAQIIQDLKDKEKNHE